MVHLWIVSAEQPVESEIPVKRCPVKHIQNLEGHSAPITCLEFSEAASLLASGCKAGSVRIWDLKVHILLRIVNSFCTRHSLSLCIPQLICAYVYIYE